MFFKKIMNKDAASSFWKWFEDHEAWIIDCFSKQDLTFIWAIGEKLKPIFPYFKKELEFQLGYNNGVWELFFFHLGKKELFRDGKTLGNMMPDVIRSRWKFILEK